MAYTSSNTIEDAHYNGFAADTNAVIGTGTGDSGYGQTNTLSTVSAAGTVTATQWSTLLARISNAASHQGTSITSLTSPTATDTISAYAALSANITATETNRLNANANGTPVTETGVNTTDWTTSLTVSNTLTFAGGDEARWFFNGGGYVQVSTVHSSGSNAKDTEWTDICTKSGTFIIYGNTSGKSGGSGSPTTNDTAKGYYNITNSSYDTTFKQFADTSPYTTNYVQVRAQMNADHADGLGNNGTVMTIEVLLQDDAADTSYDLSADSIEDNVTGTTTVSFTYYPPDTTYLTNVWGTPSLGTATVTPVGAALT